MVKTSVSGRSRARGGCSPHAALLWMALLALAGCGVSRTSVFPPERPDLAAVARETKGRAYEVLGVIQVDGQNFALEATLVDRLREKARKMGADDVLNVRVLSLPRGDGFFRYHLLTAEGVAVRWKSLAARRDFQRSGRLTTTAP